MSTPLPPAFRNVEFWIVTFWPATRMRNDCVASKIRPSKVRYCEVESAHTSGPASAETTVSCEAGFASPGGRK